MSYIYNIDQHMQFNNFVPYTVEKIFLDNEFETIGIVKFVANVTNVICMKRLQTVYQIKY